MLVFGDYDTPGKDNADVESLTNIWLYTINSSYLLIQD